MSAASMTGEQRLLLHAVSWREYERLLRVFRERPAIRLTYDRGTLEIMAPLHIHESYGRFLGRLVLILTEELCLPLKEGGSTTFRRRKKHRGLEPDNCYWIANEPAMRGKLTVDLRIDPPPDLAIEIDITHGSLDRLAIYAALRVPEVWRFDGQVLVFHILAADGTYTSGTVSLAFPGLHPDDLLRFLALRTQQDENAVARDFRDWVRQRIAARWQ
jgi:Uma2 family endonuclease